jgi:uncharacterized protein YbjT (DUF2867 family)
VRPTDHVFITGATGYIGSRLVRLLLAQRCTVHALVRPGSEGKLPVGCTPVIGDPLRRESFAEKIAPAKTFVQLVGVPHPSPRKAEQFRQVDLVSVRESVAAASRAGIAHFIYVSVAHPAPLMKAYIEVRQQGEQFIRQSGMRATILRPWYVLGPGHRWAYALLPAYWICERLPATRESARRLGLIQLNEMLRALVQAVTEPADGTRVWEVPDIRRVARARDAAKR